MFWRRRRHRRPVVSGRHPHHRAVPALPVRGAGSQNPRAAHPRLPTLRAARRRLGRLSGCVALATPRIRAPRGSTTDLPTPYGRGWPPSKSRRAQSTGTSHYHHPMQDRPGPSATSPWPLLNKQHAAHPRTAQAQSLDVAGPAENMQPQADWRCMTHYGQTLSRAPGSPRVAVPGRCTRRRRRRRSPRRSGRR